MDDQLQALVLVQQLTNNGPAEYGLTEYGPARPSMAILHAIGERNWRIDREALTTICLQSGRGGLRLPARCHECTDHGHHAELMHRDGTRYQNCQAVCY